MTVRMRGKIIRTCSVQLYAVHRSCVHAHVQHFIIELSVLINVYMSLFVCSELYKVCIRVIRPPDVCEALQLCC